MNETEELTFLRQYVLDLENTNRGLRHTVTVLELIDLVVIACGIILAVYLS